MPNDLNNRIDRLEEELTGLLSLHSQCQDLVAMPCKVITVHGARSGSQLASEPRTRSCMKTQSCLCPSAAFIDASRSTPRDNPSGEGHMKRKLFEEQERVEQAHKVIESLKDELSASKTRMSTMAKDMALLTAALQNIRTKYKHIKTYRKDAMLQIQQLQNCNADLCHKLQQEIYGHQEQIKDIKDKECIRLEQKMKAETSKVLEETETKFKRIQNQNETLKQDMHELNSKYSLAQNEIEHLKELLNGQQKDYNSKMQESDDLKTLLRSEKNKNKIISATIDKLECTVNDLLKIEKKTQQEICQLNEQVHKLESQNKNQHETISVKNQECNELDKECQKLRAQIQELSADDNNKCRKIESEMERLKKEMRDNEFLIEEERTNLKTLIQELNDVVKQHRTRIRELLHINRQQEGLLEKQRIVITNKEHESQVIQIALDNSRQKCVTLEDQLDKLNNTLRTYESKQMKEHDNSNQVKALTQELERIKALLQEEQDKLLIKGKIIDDQADTIQKLKSTVQSRTEDLNQLRSELDRVERDLENQQADKEQLQRNIEDITSHKQQLRDQILKLEETIKHKCSSEPKKLLSSLEKQVSMKHKEWELRCQLLSTEKQRAVQAAKFATQKLVDTVNDFQSQAENQKQVQDMLTNIVQSQGKNVVNIPRKAIRHKSPSEKCEPGTCPKKRVSFQY